MTRAISVDDPDAPDLPWSARDWATLAVVAAPFVVAMLVMLGGGSSRFTFVGDNALNQLRVADVGRHSVLIGPYARDGWNHLGPVMYYLLAAPYRLLGSRSVGIVVGALLINGVSVVGSVVIARRLGGRTLMLLVGIAALVLLASLGPEFVRDPWNPFLPVLAFGLLLFACWDLATGTAWELPVVAAVGTFCVQTHVSFVPLVGGVGLWSLVVAVAAWRRVPPASRSDWTRPVLVTAGLLTLLWIPPLIDQLTDVGNLGVAIRHLVRSGDTQGFSIAGRVVGDAFTLTPGWVTGNHDVFQLTGVPTSTRHTPIPVIGIALVALATWRWRRESRTARLGITMFGIAIALSVVALARTPGALYDYRLRFVWVLGAFAAAVGIWIAVRAFTSVGAPARAVVAVAALVIAGVVVAQATTTDPPQASLVHEMDAVTPSVLAALPRGSGPYTITSPTSAGAVYTAGLALRLEQAHRVVRVLRSPTAGLTWGRHRILEHQRARTITIVLDGAGVARQSAPGHRIATWAAESAARQARDRAELARLVTRYPAARRPPFASERIAHILDRTRALTVFVTGP